MTAVDGCMLCAVAEADSFFSRTRVWEDDLWRLSVVLRGALPGFCHLETRRHVPAVTDLDGEEAATFGPVLARSTRAVRDATGADRVYAYVFGDRVPHFHVNLAPHREGGPLVGGRGLLAPGTPDAPAEAHEAAAGAIRESF
ncbi:HIT family protein [Geodermatophilus sp. SYSU D01045]